MDIEWVRQYCTSLPGAGEDIKWGDNLCFLVGGKMFCVTSLERPFSLTFKVPYEKFEELIASNDFKPARYLARAKWVTLAPGARVGLKELKIFIRQSYDLVRSGLSLKVQKQLGF